MTYRSTQRISFTLQPRGGQQPVLRVTHSISGHRGFTRLTAFLASGASLRTGIRNAVDLAEDELAARTARGETVNRTYFASSTSDRDIPRNGGSGQKIGNSVEYSRGLQAASVVRKR
jgi:hypothetical protein